MKCNSILSDYLVTLASNSEYLCSILIRDPGLMEVLSRSDALEGAYARESLEEDLARLSNAYESRAALYRLRDGEMLRVAMRELINHSTVAQVGDELTMLAEVILVHALEQARAKVDARYGPTDAPFVILGVGKLGGWEMGYGSDLDLIFVYEADHEIGAAVTPLEYFPAVASFTLKSLKERTRYGVLYDVDARLRPDGSKGVLAVGRKGIEEYYREEAQPWERLALMKARAVAGDPAFAERVEGLAKDLAFSRPLDQASLELVESLRRKMVRQASPLDLKRAEGGISETEFIVRFWQLRHVHKYPELKRSDVFGALDILEEHQLIDADQTQAVRRAYDRLRKILNRVRMMDGGHTDMLPSAPDERNELASRIGIDGDLLEHVNEHKTKIHGIYIRTLGEAWGSERTYRRWDRKT